MSKVLSWYAIVTPIGTIVGRSQSIYHKDPSSILFDPFIVVTLSNEDGSVNDTYVPMKYKPSKDTIVDMESNWIILHHNQVIVHWSLDNKESDEMDEYTRSIFNRPIVKVINERGNDKGEGT